MSVPHAPSAPNGDHSPSADWHRRHRSSSAKPRGTTITALKTPDPKHLGARIGPTAVLHSWGSALTPASACPYHCPGRRFFARRSALDFLPAGLLPPPVQVLSRLFRGLFLGKLTGSYEAGYLHFFGGSHRPGHASQWTDCLSATWACPKRTSRTTAMSPRWPGPAVSPKFRPGFVRVTARRLRMAEHAQIQAAIRPRGRAIRPMRQSVSACTLGGDEMALLIEMVVDPGVN